jgi:hypothetical protein
MRVRLAQGRVARARMSPARSKPVTPSSFSPFPQLIAPIVEDDGERDANSRPATWPPYAIDRDDAGFRLIDIDASIDWDGWRLPQFDEIEGGEK